MAYAWFTGYIWLNYCWPLQFFGSSSPFGGGGGGMDDAFSSFFGGMGGEDNLH